MRYSIATFTSGALGCGGTVAELDWARHVILAHSEAKRAGRGVVLLDGRLVENVHVEEASRLVSRRDELLEPLPGPRAL